MGFGLMENKVTGKVHLGDPSGEISQTLCGQNLIGRKAKNFKFYRLRSDEHHYESGDCLSCYWTYRSIREER
jgi:hypothetical protein